MLLESKNFILSFQLTPNKNICISAVNIRKGGTLTVLRDCLSYLSGRKDLNVTALVYKKSLCEFEGISYIEIPWSIKGWGRRLWCEYVTMGKISKKMDEEPDLWLSLHDTTPRVKAKHQAVYCHTSFPFMKIRLRDFRMDFKIPLFSIFTRYAYRIFSRRNDYLIVQQEWFKKGLSSLIGFPEEKIIVAPPSFKTVPIPAVASDDTDDRGSKQTVFFYPSTPDCHKNFELVCDASSILENKFGPDRFKVVLTLDGCENKYASCLLKSWGHLSSIDFHGYMSKEELGLHYSNADCLVFTSRIETWGLPISEFSVTGKPMILSDLPYAHESAAGCRNIAFSRIDDPSALALLMEEVITGEMPSFGPVGEMPHGGLYAGSWDDLFNILLPSSSTLQTS